MSFPVVGVGASAGGLEAFTQLLRELPANSGMAFVLIQHLDRSHKSLLVEVLSKTTRMVVQQVNDDQLVEPNHVYVIPPGCDISIRRARLLVTPRTTDKSRLHLPVDDFFTALAAERGSQAVGVILSGTASDGTEGMRAIKAAGGTTLVQDPTTAKFPGMPASAIAAGVVDHTLSIAALAGKLMRLRSLPAGNRSSTVVVRIKELLKIAIGVDFTEYKPATFQRRLARRMAVLGIESAEGYLQLLQREPEEVRALYENTLIHVSSFFRDVSVFDAVKDSVIPAIIKDRPPGGAIRIWVAGCSTGEEVYSLAISVLECLGDAVHPQQVQLFGSDVSELAVQTARAGKYSTEAMAPVNEERRRRFFTEVDGSFCVNKSVRELCVFVRHDLARDPPFSRLDLLSCRNVLIYFDKTLQKRLLPIFHYSLNQPGFLLLGRGEHVAGFDQLFKPCEGNKKIFERMPGRGGLRFNWPRSSSAVAVGDSRASGVPDLSSQAREIALQLTNLLVARYAPPGVLVTEKLDVIQFFGKTGAYLQTAAGAPQNNVVKMARAGLMPKLRATVALARREMAPVRADAVEFDDEGATRLCNLVVLPFAGIPDTRPLFVILFEEVVSPGAGKQGHRVARRGDSRPGARARESRVILKADHELATTNDYLNSLIEEHSRTNDDLGSANEELMSGNEELQSLNEELETAKEELQSTNEELTTVNDELNHRNLEVGLINSDLTNLLDAVEIPIVILDKDRRIRRFTPKACQVMSLQASDVGRLFDDIKPRLNTPDLDQQVLRVIETFTAEESEVQDRAGRWFRMQLRPFKGADRRVEGVVISLFDIDVLKHHLGEAEDGKRQAESADRAKDEFLAVLSHELRTPLTALVMQVHLLRREGADAARRDRACDAIERSIKSQVNLTDDLLDVSRIVTGKMRVDLQRIDLTEAVQATIDGVSALAASKSIALSCSLEPGVLSVAADRARLEQIVANLLVNAVKFTPDGGRIEVSLSRTAGHAQVRIADNGSGIDAAFMPRIFDRLVQKDGSSTRRHSGLGLGLAIVRHLVKAHGGTITAESAGLNLGSTFTVTFPLLPDAHASQTVAQEGAEELAEVRAAADPGGKTPLAGVKILVVEDDSDISEVLAEIFTQMGASVRTAPSAAAALNTFRTLRPDVMVCDVALPDEDGYGLIKKIRALASAEGGDTPALALTARATDADRLQALAAGFQMYLSKPVDIQCLTDAVAQLTGGTGPSVEPRQGTTVAARN
ncbi:MAG: chemotaxis protein CheB [Polyangia bacterium]